MEELKSRRGADDMRQVTWCLGLLAFNASGFWTKGVREDVCNERSSLVFLVPMNYPSSLRRVAWLARFAL